MKKFLSFLFNFFWVITIGLTSAIYNAVVGFTCCLTIIGIPFGLQYFKFIKLVFAPAGKVVITKFSRHPIMNIIWLICGGLLAGIIYLFWALIFGFTIIGMPISKQLLKIAKFCVAPFGCEVLKDGEYSKDRNLKQDREHLASRIKANPNVVISVDQNGEQQTVAKYINSLGPEIVEITKKERERQIKIKVPLTVLTVILFVIAIIISFAMQPLIISINSELWGMLLYIVPIFAVAGIFYLIRLALIESCSKDVDRFFDDKLSFLMDYYPNGSPEEPIIGLSDLLVDFVDEDLFNQLNGESFR